MENAVAHKAAGPRDSFTGDDQFSRRRSSNFRRASWDKDQINHAASSSHQIPPPPC